MKLNKINLILADYFSLIYEGFLPEVFVKSRGYIFIKRFLSLCFIYFPYVSIYLLRGKEKYSGLSLLTLFVGREEEIKHICDFIYKDNPSVKKIAKTFVWNTYKKFSLFSDKAELIFVEFNKIFSNIFSKQGYFIMPKWISLSLDLSISLNKILNNSSVKSDLRRIRKYKYSFETSRKLNSLKYFYHKMYLPYLFKSHGKVAIIKKFNYMKYLYKKGFLLLVKKDSKYIAGLLSIKSKDTLILRYIGVLNGDSNYVRKGVVSAAYYFTILYAKKQGYKNVHFGLTRPFLNDGIFIYKRKWQTKVIKNVYFTSTYAFRPYTYSNATKEFLSNHPFISENNGLLEANLFVRTDLDFFKQKRKELLEDYSILGLDSVKIFSLDKLNK